MLACFFRGWAVVDGQRVRFDRAAPDEEKTAYNFPLFFFCSDECCSSNKRQYFMLVYAVGRSSLGMLDC